MGYQKPKCECGHDLVWWSQPIYTVRYHINKNGKKAKKPIKLGVNCEIKKVIRAY